MASNGDPGRTTGRGPRAKEISPKSESDRSNNGNRSNQSAQNKWSDQSHNRQTHYRQEKPTRGRESSADQRERSRYNKLMTLIAQLPSQIMWPFDYQFQGKLHPRLPIRSLDEGCSHAEQYRRWINDIPTRRSERLKEMVRWMYHFEAAKEVPIHTVTLNVDSLDVTCWWCDFFIELGVLDEEVHGTEMFTNQTSPINSTRG